jgi:hypothetical protein
VKQAHDFLRGLLCLLGPSPLSSGDLLVFPLQSFGIPQGTNVTDRQSIGFRVDADEDPNRIPEFGLQFPKLAELPGRLNQAQFAIQKALARASTVALTRARYSRLYL